MGSSLDMDSSSNYCHTHGHSFVGNHYRRYRNFEHINCHEDKSGLQAIAYRKQLNYSLTYLHTFPINVLKEGLTSFVVFIACKVSFTEILLLGFNFRLENFSIQISDLLALLSYS